MSGEPMSVGTETSFKPDNLFDAPSAPASAAPAPEATAVDPGARPVNLFGELKPIEITPEDYAAMERHILGEPYFRKTYTLAGGSLRAEFRSRTVEESDMLQAQLSKDLAEKRLSPLTSMAGYAQAYYQYLVACSLVVLTRKDAETKAETVLWRAPADAFANALAIRSQFLKGRSDLLVRSLCDTMHAFERLQEALVEKCADPNFSWESVRGGSA